MKRIERPLNSFTSVEELNEYIIENNILEKKNTKKATEEEKDEKTEEEKETNKRKAVKKDKAEVKYAQNEVTNIFEHIILFTNSKDPKDNKTLKNILDAVKEFKKAKTVVPQVHMFLAESTTFEVSEDTEEITIRDDDDELVIDDSFDNTNTLIFSRLGVQGEEGAEAAVVNLQDRGFLVLNPLRYAELASNKYDSAVLFEKAEIPQPNFCLMTKDILYDEKLYKESMKRVYKSFTGDGDKDEDLSFVVKILNGHGGTGVAVVDGKKIVAILQMIFAIDPERQLLIQKKEEADGGDIRVHVLTLREKQVIVAAMKRVKLGGDFRSNVSLGASAEKVELTPEQEQIAVKTAKISKLPWCAVDIMPLVKGSNKEIGDNVVLEINASPGTDGITDVIGENFVVKLISELDDPSEFCLQDKTSGYIEAVTVDFGSGPVEMLAKLDTGNGAKASHMEVGEIKEKSGHIHFTLNGKSYSLKKIGDSEAITGQQIHKRPVVEIDCIKLGKRKVKKAKMALVEQRDKSTNVLINRDLLTALGMVVSPGVTHLLTKEIEKVKII